MANPIFTSCCRCQSLRTGSIIAGVGAILLSIVSIIIAFTARATYRTIFFDWLPPWIVKIIIVFNLCMTILISAIMIVGAMKVSWYQILQNKRKEILTFFLSENQFISQRNHYLMLPWVVLGCMLIVGFLLSIIYTGVMFIIDGLIMTAVVLLILGILTCG